jgi:2-acylglycerol O-acyltransferase 2
MSAVVNAPLNPEPSQPQERVTQHLPPKSYAEAAVEGTESGARELPSEENGDVPSNDASDTKHPNAVNGSAKENGLRHNIDGRVLYDKHISQNGEKLTSIKPDESYEQALKHHADSASKQMGRSGKKQDANDAKLASGRRAGAGWQRSA